MYMRVGISYISKRYSKTNKCLYKYQTINIYNPKKLTKYTTR